MTRIAMLALSPLLALSTPAAAADAPDTRLVQCGSQSCLLVSGRRADNAVPVSINGHEVATSGARRWRARVPVATIRSWSLPYAQSISITVAETAYDARLPVGMLGPKRDLALLVVRVK
ncbi:hypothetical protein [Blastomonas sp.]|uniref:hypothetical protein n=1 Tax=Blastomonas sp. TaxID=1909299 RepID=UPI002615D7E8|nr:hypothetical protein [Blastomonas sp.]MDM7955252.1 hypothetical protein [Blastomonas sp.]